MGNIRDGIIIEISKDIEGCGHLVILEGFSCPLAKKKNASEYVNRVLVQIDLKDALFMRVVLVFLLFVLIVTIALVSLFVRGNAPVTLGLATGFKDVILRARHHNFSPGLDAACWPCHYKGLGRGCAAFFCWVN
jgi:hypothetical protein